MIPFFKIFLHAAGLWILLLIGNSVLGQRMDSIKYTHGYLYYHVYGSGEPVVILAGGPGVNYQQLEEVGLALAKDHQAIFFEQRGTGRSIPKPFDTSTISIDAALSDLELLLKHLRLKEAHFLGHSWGGMLALSFAAHHPAKVKSLILLDPGPYKMDRSINETFSGNIQSRLSPADKRTRDSIFSKRWSGNFTPEDQLQFDKWELIPVFYDRTMVDSLVEKINKGGNHPEMGSLIFHSLRKKRFDLTKQLSSFKKPVHIISGSQDPGAFVSYEIKLLMPQTKLHWINHAGHFPMYEQPARFYEALNRVMRLVKK